MKRLINILKDKRTYALAFLMTLLLNLKAYASDPGDPAQIGEVFEKIQPDIEDMIKPISAVLVFVAVMILGINIIVKRNKVDERSSLMMGLVPIAIGAFILGSAGLIYEFIMSLAVEG